nr:T-cell surface glycoprotein CD3 gamma chain-like [Anolis sagrei ordinatus]
MGRVCHPWSVATLGLLFAGTVVIFAKESASETGLSIKVKQNGRNVTLHCVGGSELFNWTKDGVLLKGHEGEELPLGSAMDDPRGSFSCQSKDQTASMQVFFRMCQNCIHLDAPTILGIGIASLVATLFLAVAVFCLAVEEPSLRSQASDKQNLLANEQLYQPLGERNNGQYSHVGVAKTRRR